LINVLKHEIDLKQSWCISRWIICIVAEIYFQCTCIEFMQWNTYLYVNGLLED